MDLITAGTSAGRPGSSEVTSEPSAKLGREFESR